MGFKYKKFSFTGGTAEFPSGTLPADIKTKEESIVSGFATNLIACNCGWQLDSNRHDSITDFFDVPKMSSNTAAPGLFLINTTSGCKLFITYIDDGSGTNHGMAFYDTDGVTKIMPQNDWVVCRYHSSYAGNPLSLQGFIMSMIPAGSSYNFGQTVDASFLPAEATRLWGSAANIAHGYSYGPYLGTRIAAGNMNTFCVWATPYCVGYGVKNATGGGEQSFDYAVGRVIGDLANQSADTSIQAKYGVVTFKSSTSSSIAEMYGSNSGYTTLSKSKQIFNIGNYWTAWVWGDTLDSSISSMGQESTIGGYGLWGFSVCKTNGEWVSRTSTSYVTVHANAIMTLSNVYFDYTSNNRPWCPFAVLYISSDPQNECIANGNGMKGYLDTDLFRCSDQYPLGTVLDNGNFVCTGDGYLTLGWDPTNESW